MGRFPVSMGGKPGKTLFHAGDRGFGADKRANQMPNDVGDDPWNLLNSTP
jgi:hypothetical protein